MKLAFTIEGPPVPKARPRKGRRGHFYTPEKTRRYERSARHAAHLAMMISGLALRWPKNARYMLRLRIHKATDRRLDADNVAKSLADAFTGALWADDHQVGFEVPPPEIDRLRPRVEVEVEVLP